MMTFFPVPYEDEVLYSVLARYHVRSGNISYKATMKDLFGSTSVTAVMDLPSNIHNLVNNMPLNSQYTEEYLIKNHTLFPFYTAFLPPERAERVFQSMKGENGGSVYSRTGIMASSVTLNQYFKFCPVCAKEDKLQYGELYWHRVHQIPGVLICPKHHVPLYDSQVPVRGYNKHEYKAAGEENCVKPDIVINYSDDVFEKLVRLAEDAQVLLNSDFEKRNIEWYKEQYLAKMMKMGFATVNGKVYRKRLIKEFINYYGEVFLDIVQSSVDADNDSNWLMDMVRKKNKTAHPIRHLLLSRFLGISLPDLFYKKMEYKPFGDGPWPCLNAASDPNTVKKYAKKLGLTTYWEKRSEADVVYDYEKSSYSSMKLDDKDYYREKWNELRKQYPEMGKTQLRQVDKALFAWLYRYDREWLNQAYLDSVKETNHDFRLRRIRWAVKELEKEGEELQMWKIIRKAGIREEYQAKLMEVVANLLVE